LSLKGLKRPADAAPGVGAPSPAQQAHPPLPGRDHAAAATPAAPRISLKSRLSLKGAVSTPAGPPGGHYGAAAGATPGGGGALLHHAHNAPHTGGGGGGGGLSLKMASATPSVAPRPSLGLMGAPAPHRAAAATPAGARPLSRPLSAATPASAPPPPSAAAATPGSNGLSGPASVFATHHQQQQQ
jgi:hypothetical protein